MKTGNKKVQASSTVEYTALLTLFLAAMIILQPYIWRGFMGRWKASGDTFGHGRQFDPRPYGVLGADGGTLECFYDFTHCKCDNANCPVSCSEAGLLNAWIDARCYEFGNPAIGQAPCDCTIPPDLVSEYRTKCLMCLYNCSQYGLSPACGVEGPRN